ncbi:MAG: single-stranded-DNA-specific exonuclease RecJ [Clostridiales bacterium]|jgi:single-stranded-DNA-specific exonuclease|nr:single-stranded-DNA-specific exonuclease RecJ [Clostridiales bacterium]
MNTVIKRRNETAADREVVSALARETGLDEVFAELLVSRGLKSGAEARRFLYPDTQNLSDPFLMKGMTEAARRIQTAIDNRENVVIYGDYDVDGISATAILSLFLASKGLNVYSHIPNRSSEGYGLNEKSLAAIIERSFADLIVTCDCGISGYREVEFCKELGVEIIVTDHHEVSGQIPDCIVVNPKQADCGYPDTMLCGAGVAFKLVHALGGLDAALEYIDLAALATVADLVPLLNENRLIVQLGLEAIAKKKNLGLSLLIADQELTRVTSGDIAYKLAPRINAAGRLGDAYRAFELLTTRDVAAAREIIDELNGDNQKRKELCDTLYGEAAADLSYENMTDDRAIILSHPDWEKGITGIVAARLAGDYRRPAFILVKSGDAYKGTCRGIEGVSVYALLSGAAEYLIEFGGHAQAAGFSIAEKNIPAFKAHVNAALKELDETLFYPSVSYDIALDADKLTESAAASLKLLEPTGNGNPRPLFKVTAGELRAAPCKNNPAHISFSLPGGLNVFAFGYARQAYQLLGTGKRELVIELQEAAIGRQAYKGILRGCSPEALYINDDAAAGYPYALLKYPADGTAAITNGNGRLHFYAPDEPEAPAGNALYGTLLIADGRACYERAAARLPGCMIHEYMYPVSANNYSKIIVAPDLDQRADFAHYKKIVFLFRPFHDGPARYLQALCGADVYLPDMPPPPPAVKTGRDEFLRYFAAIKRAAITGAGSEYAYFKRLSAAEAGLTYPQFLVCAAVFGELGLLTASKTEKGYGLCVNPGVKAELAASPIYRFLSGLES